MDEALPLFRRAAAGVEKRKFAHEHAGPIIGGLSTCLERLKRYEEAESWRRRWLAVLEGRSGTESVAYAAELTSLGSNLIRQQRWADAEPVLRKALAIRQAKLKDDWKTFNTQALLGTSLLGKGEYPEAEPLLQAGYEGMRRREDRIPASVKYRLTEALESLVRLYHAWNKPALAAKWRKELEARPNE
jgi:tetratricopeptide (TPR) repeat protein